MTNMMSMMSSKVQSNNLEAFKSYIESGESNIMDYSISYANRFTEDQAERIRYILEHGAFVPGPKNRATKAKQTRSTGMLDLPMQIMK